MSRNNKYSEAVTNEKERSVILGEYIKETGATVRQTARKYGVSKSTVHTVVTFTNGEAFAN